MNHLNVSPDPRGGNGGFETSCGRSRSNSIAAGAIARLRDVPKIWLSLPPEDLLPCPGDENACQLASSSSPDSPASRAGSRLHPDCVPSQSEGSAVGAGVPDLLRCRLHTQQSLAQQQQHKGKGSQRKRVLDQKDLNLRPECNVRMMRRNSLPLNQQQEAGNNTGFMQHCLTISSQLASGRTSRRLSQVSSIVSAQIQSTLAGWRSSVSEEEVVDQGRCLAAKFVWIQLRRSGFCHRRFHLQRLRSVCRFSQSEELDYTLNQVVGQLMALSRELQAAHPKLFHSVLNQVGSSCMQSVTTVTKTQRLMALFLLSSESMSWTHVAAFFSITAALALDSMISGHHDFVLPLIDSFTESVAGDMARWVASEGGWVSAVLIPLFSPHEPQNTTVNKLRGLLLLLLLVRGLTCLLMPCACRMP